jgi:hypothetical protein
VTRGIAADYHPALSETPRRGILMALLLLGALALGAFSLYLARHRIYQVDEVQNVYMARTIGMHRWNDFATSAPLFLLGPLSWIARHGTTSAGILEAHRLVFLGVFWLNILLLAAAAGARKADHRGVTIFLLAATLAPLWDYGFEIRHDNLLETGILIVWILGRHAGQLPAHLRYFLIGAIPVLLQFCAFKAFLYFVPICGLFLLFPNPELGVSRLRAWAHAALGALTGFLAAWSAHAATGTWDVYLRAFRASVGVAQEAASFSSWPALARLLPQTPLLVAGIILFAILAAREALTRRIEWVSWRTTFPESLFLLHALAVFFLNPTPFPYNLVFVVPQVFLAIVAAVPLMQPLTSRLSKTVLRFSVAGLVLAHLAPFLSHTLRHLDYTNSRQLRLAAAAEAMTDPVHDRVYDGSGLVVTRDSIGYYLYLHSLNIRNFENGTYPSVRSMLELRPASVLLPSYRTNWLPDADQLFISANYIPLSRDFLVLGAEMPASGTWRCLKTGRYRVFVAPPDRADLVRVDGRQVLARPASLEKGPHFFDIPENARVLVVWVGPTLDEPPALGSGAPERTFINFY